MEIQRASALFNSLENDLRATNPPLTPTFSPNTSNQNFQIGILFNVVESFGNKVFKDDSLSTPIALRARVVSYALVAYMVFIESGLEIERDSAFLIVGSD